MADFEVYKGHQACATVGAHFDFRDVIYVVRDVRDVAVSGAHYFSFERRSIASRLMSCLGRLRGCDSESRRVRAMLRVLANGDSDVSEWCGRPWDVSVNEYLDAGALVVRYEDLLDAPERQCLRLLAHLGVERSATWVRSAIQTQSFAAAKSRFLERRDFARAKFLREGRAGGWRTALTVEERAYCLERFGRTLARLNYDPDGSVLQF